ncbi:MAG: cofactor assembly of complex C subunit B, partial [Prochlorococcaceae cyanobacterium]
MALPPPARLSLGVGVAGLVLVVTNQLSADAQDPALIRAGVLAALLAVGLMLVAVLWTRAVPEAASRASLQGREGLELAPDLREPLRQELGWGSQMLLTASPAAVVLVWWRGQVLLRRGLLAEAAFSPGPICRRALERQQAISLVNLALYPGRDEFEALLPGLPAVLV